MSSSTVDLAVIGGGAGGLGATRAATIEGASVVMITDHAPGGDCTFTGCVPSKALIEMSRSGATFEQALTHVADVVDRIAATENVETLRHEGAQVVEGRGRLVDRRTIAVGDALITAKKIILATGSRPAVPPIPGLAETPCLTNEQFFEPRSRPASLAIIGGGPIGCELGEAMQRFGTQVTIIEAASRLLGRVEPDASMLVTEALERRGVDVQVNTAVTRVAHTGGQFELTTPAGTLRVDELLVATGRRPNTESLGLEAAGVETDARGWIRTDRWLRTSARGIWAVGDVNGVQQLSHAADEMGRVAAWSALRAGRRYAYDPARIPSAVFTTPEVATIGVVESDAPTGSRVAEAPMSMNDRALAAGSTDGFVRLIARPAAMSRHLAGGRVVGATIVGERAGELINEVALVMRSNAYAGRLAQTVRSYPSWSTVMQKAAARWFQPYEGESWRAPRRS